MNKKRLKELDELLTLGETDVIPKEWYNRQQVAKANGKSVVQSDKLLKRLVEARLVERRMFRVRTNSGIRPVPYFFFGVASVSRAKRGLGRAKR